LAHPDFKLQVAVFASSTFAFAAAGAALAFAHAAAFALHFGHLQPLGQALAAAGHAFFAFAHAFLHLHFSHLHLGHTFLAFLHAALAFGHVLAALAGHAATAAFAFGASSGLLHLKMLHPVNNTTARIAINAFLIIFPFLFFVLYIFKLLRLIRFF